MDQDQNAGGVYFGPPDGYIEPRWPGLYQPFATPKYLYEPYAIWRFTVLWTLVLFGVIFFLAGLLFVPIFAKRHFRLSLLAPLVFTTFGLLGGFLSATIVGYCLAALYNAAFLRMSTWVPALYGVIQALVLIVGSYAIIS